MGLRKVTLIALVASAALGHLAIACAKSDKNSDAPPEIDPERNGPSVPDAAPDSSGPPVEVLDAGALPPADSGRTTCDLAAPFERIERPGGPLSPFPVRPTSDERAVYFSMFKVSGFLNFRFDLYSASRPDTASVFGPASTLIGEGINTGTEGMPFVTEDGLTLFFTSRRVVDGGPGGENIWAATRPSTFVEFSKPSLVGGVNGADTDTAPYYSAATQELFFASTRAPRTGLDLYRAVKTGAGFLPPERLVELDGPGDETVPVLSSDGLTLFFSGGTALAGDAGIDRDIFMAQRSKVGAPFGTPKRVDSLSSKEFESPSWVSADGCRLWYHAVRDGGAQNPLIAVRVPR